MTACPHCGQTLPPDFPGADLTQRQRRIADMVRRAAGRYRMAQQFWSWLAIQAIQTRQFGAIHTNRANSPNSMEGRVIPPADSSVIGPSLVQTIMRARDHDNSSQTAMEFAEMIAAAVLAYWKRTAPKEEAAAWDDIASAPRDGSALLVSQNGVSAIAGWSRLGGYWQILPCSPSGEVNPINPDHWRPLPSPPGKEGAPP